MKSIRSRLLVWQLGALLLACALGGALSYELAWRGFNHLRDEGLEQIAYSVMRHDTQDAQDLVTAGPNGNGAPAANDAYSDDQGQFVSQIWTPQGQIIYASLDDTGPPLQAPGWHRVRWNGTHWRTYTLQDADRLIQVATTSELRSGTFTGYVPWLLAPLLLLLGLLAVLIRASVTGALSPLNDLKNALARREPNDLQALPTNTLPEEVRPLVETLNQMLSTVDHLLSSQRRFLADVAHELNTPLAAIKLQAQLAQRAQAQQQPWPLDELHSGIDRAVHLVAQLLQMARLEPQAEPYLSAPVDLQKLARNRVMAFWAQADLRHIDLGLDSPEPVRLLGDPHALGVLIDNLIDNALRYSTAGTSVDVRAVHEGELSVLEVVDHGPGMADADKPRALERFVRLRPDASAGSGLGLAIVRHIAQQHGAELHMLDTLGGGLTVRVVWPDAGNTPTPTGLGSDAAQSLA